MKKGKLLFFLLLFTTLANLYSCKHVLPITCSELNFKISATETNALPNQANGTISVTATGGSGFQYSLNGGSFQDSGYFSGLAGSLNYRVVGHNSLGCTDTTIVNIGTTNPCQGVTIFVNTTIVNPGANLSNGSITATATGGTGFTYSINNGAYQSSGVFSNLAAGNYTVTAKSSLGCTGSTVVTLSAPGGGGGNCTNVNIVITPTVVNTTPCSTPANNGSITVTAIGSTGFTYNLNAGAYQTSNVFANLTAATYTVGVKDLNGCTNTTTATVGVAPQGPTFAPVVALISARCSGTSCHIGPGQSASGYNFDNPCSIVTYWSTINNACVTGSNMPKSPQAKFTAAEKQTYTNWINAGHGYSN